MRTTKATVSRLHNQAQWVILICLILVHDAPMMRGCHVDALWVWMVFIHWMNRPVGLIACSLIGLLFDALDGVALGLTPLAMMGWQAIVPLMWGRIQPWPLWGQSCCIAMSVLIYAFPKGLWLLLYQPNGLAQYNTTIVSTMLIWPLIHTISQDLFYGRVRAA